MKLHLRFGMHREIEAIHLSQGLIDGLVIPAHILAYQHASTSAFICSLPSHDYVIDPMTFIVQGEIHRHFSEGDALRTSVQKWCDQVYPEIADILIQKKKAGDGGALSASDLPDIESLCQRLRDFQESAVDLGHVDPRAKKYLDRYEVTSPSGPRALVAPYFCFENIQDDWFLLNNKSCDLMREVAPKGRDVGAVLACSKDVLESSKPSDVASAFSSAQRVFLWVDKLSQSSIRADTINRVRALARELNGNGKAVEFLYGGFMSMLMGYQDGVRAISHGILYTQDKSFQQVPGSGGVPERYYIPEFHEFRSLSQANLILKKHPELCGGTPTSRQVIKNDPDNIVYFLKSPELLRQHFLEARRAEINSLEELSLDEQLEALSRTYGSYHDSVKDLPNPDAVLSSSGMKGLDYLKNWIEAFSAG